jgi:ketosteroid isomerase-like protein
VLSWLAKRLVTYVMAQNRAGNLRPQLMLYAPDVTLTFPGDNSWSGVFEGREQVKAWNERTVAVGLQAFPDEVIAAGWPWNMTVCVRARDHVRSPDGEFVYQNRFVLWIRMVWGRIKEYEVYEDTIAPRALDAYLERVGGSPAVPASRAISG